MYNECLLSDVENDTLPMRANLHNSYVQAATPAVHDILAGDDRLLNEA